MAKFKFETQEEKKRLQERAQSLRPKAHNVIATDMGWAQARPNGTLELLVSFQGLDSLLGDIDVEVTDETPIEVQVIAEPEVESVQESTEVEVAPAVEDEEDEPVVVAPKKTGGRPKKVAE